MKYFLIITFLIGFKFITLAQERLIIPAGETVKSRIKVPDSFQRFYQKEGTFGYYLQNLPLKKHNSLVKYYNGAVKPNNNIYIAVVNIDIGKKNLLQCADAVMKLRAEYLFGSKQFEKIQFNLTNGFRFDYLKWQEGYRLRVDGNRTYWIKSASFNPSYKTFLEYLDVVFMYAGTMSLSKELKKIKYNDIKPGDLLIKGGSPGHAVIILDMAENTKNGQKIYLLAQSYMPAQEIQILTNPLNSNLSPWYLLDGTDKTVITPEWVFATTETMRFIE